MSSLSCSWFSSNIRWSMVVCLLCSHLLVRVKVGTGSWSVISLWMWESVPPPYLSPHWASWSGSGSMNGPFLLAGILSAWWRGASRETGWKKVKLEKTSSVHGPGQSCLLDLFFLLPVYSWDLEFLRLSLASKPLAGFFFIQITHIFSKQSSGFGWRLKGSSLLGKRWDVHGFPRFSECSSLMNYSDNCSKVLCICELLASRKNSFTSGVLPLLWFLCQFIASASYLEGVGREGRHVGVLCPFPWTRSPSDLFLNKILYFYRLMNFIIVAYQCLGPESNLYQPIILKKSVYFHVEGRSRLKWSWVFQNVLKRFSKWVIQVYSWCESLQKSVYICV